MLKDVFVQASARFQSYDDYLHTLILMQKRNILYFDGDMVKYQTPTNKPNGMVFLCSLIWPFIDTFWITLVYIYTLFPDKTADQDKVSTKIQWFAESLYEDNIILHYESCSIDFISMAVEHFIEKGVIIQDDSKGDCSQIALHPDYQKDDELIQAEFDKITFYKKLSLIKFTNLKSDIQKTMLSDFPMMSNL